MEHTNFWEQLPAGFFSLAPMEDVTDTAFREVVLSVSGAGILKVLFTEFTSTDGLLDKRGYERVSERLIVNASEQHLLKKMDVKLVAQIWGNDPEKFYQSAKIITAMGLFDGIDINMGCPVKKVVKKNTCSALIKQPELAKEIIRATQEGTPLPVSVKTRIGFNQAVTESWIEALLSVNPAAITVHGRTQKMLSEGHADWDEIAKAVGLRNRLNAKCTLIGNGDVASYQDGLHKIETSHVDGVMVGRGIFKNPWMFAPTGKEPGIADKINLLKMHVKLYEQTWKSRKSINPLKRFFKIYIHGFKGASALRAQLMEAKDYSHIYDALSFFMSGQDNLPDTEY